MVNKRSRNREWNINKMGIWNRIREIAIENKLEKWERDNKQNLQHADKFARRDERSKVHVQVRNWDISSSLKHVMIFSDPQHRLVLPDAASTPGPNESAG